MFTTKERKQRAIKFRSCFYKCYHYKKMSKQKEDGERQDIPSMVAWRKPERGWVGDVFKVDMMLSPLVKIKLS